MQKKRRNVKGKGSMEEMNGVCDDWKLRKIKSEEIDCWMSDIVVVEED